MSHSHISPLLTGGLKEPLRRCATNFVNIKTEGNATKLSETSKITLKTLKGGTSNKANIKKGSDGQSLRRLKWIAILFFANLLA